MQAFHNDPRIKERYLARVRAHRAADEIIHGDYWRNGKGCAVGCTLHSANHASYETELGIPQTLERLEDNIFEALPAPDDTLWPEQFLDAIPVGADLSMVWPQFAVALLGDPDHGVMRYVKARKYGKQRKAIQRVMAYYQQWIDTHVQPAVYAAVAAYTAADAAYAAADDAADTAHTATYAAVAAAYTATYAADAAGDIPALFDARGTETAYAAASAADAAASAAAVAVGIHADDGDDAAAATADAAYAAARADMSPGARQWQASTLLALLRQAPIKEA